MTQLQNPGAAPVRPGQIHDVVRFLQRSRDLHPDDLRVRTLLARGLFSTQRLAEAEFELRHAVTLPDAKPSTFKQLADLLRRRGDAAAAYRLLATDARVANTRSHILIACMPKSGSTWLRTTLSEVADLRAEQFCPWAHHREQEVDYHHLMKPRDYYVVAQQHVRCTEVTIDAIRKFNIIPFVLTRNIFDNLVSARDHFANPKRTMATSQFFLDERFRDWDEERQLAFLVDFFVPWIFNFIASWWYSPLESIWIRYEQLREEPEEMIAMMLRQSGVPSNRQAIEAALERVRTGKADQTLFNVGRAGRGAGLPPEIRSRVMRIRAYYPDIPFEDLGLL